MGHELPGDGSGRALDQHPTVRTVITSPSGVTSAEHDDSSTPVKVTSADCRPVPGYLGFYVAHRHGVIASLDRVIETCDGRAVRLRGVVLTPVVDRRTSTRGVTLSKNGRLDSRRVGALVLAAFGEPAPWPWAAVVHLNGDKSDLRLENLRWGRMGGARR